MNCCAALFFGEVSDEVGRLLYGWRRRRQESMDKIRALIVDDSSVMRKIVERSLRQAGVDFGAVAEASNGAEALTVLAENAVDLILCDINMPVMDGIEFV